LVSTSDKKVNLAVCLEKTSKIRVYTNYFLKKGHFSVKISCIATYWEKSWKK